MSRELPPPPADCKLGCLERQWNIGERFTKLSDVMDIPPRSKWLARLQKRQPMRKHVKLIHYQNGEGSCGSNAAITGGIYVPRSVAGLPFVHLAPSSLYKQVNRGQDAGSAVDANLDALEQTGCVPVSMWGGELGWNKSYPPEFKEEAAKYQVDESSDASTFEELFWGTMIGFAPPFGVFWKDDRGREGGHAITAIDPIYENGKWGLTIVNSWGVNWGDQGFGKLWEPQISRGVEYFGGFIPRVATFSEG